MDLNEAVIARANDQRCAGVGVCDAAPFSDVARTLNERIASGTSGTLGFTYTAPDVATDIAKSFPWARRMVVLAMAYVPEAGYPGETLPNTGRIARFATADHYERLRSALDAIARFLRAEGHRAEFLVDDSRLVDRAAAVRAGVAWWGKSAMVLVPGSGPWVLLGSVVTDAPLTCSAPMQRDCGTCVACLPACPTGAIVAPGLLDARLCLSHWLQAPGVIPRELRAAVDDRVYGCDDCLDACPPGHRLLATSSVERGRHDLLELVALDDDRLLGRFPHFYIPGRRARHLRRNILVALGNRGDERAVAVLAGYGGHPDWLLRVHAVWALGNHGTTSTRHLLAALERDERHPEVRNEFESLGFPCR